MNENSKLAIFVVLVMLVLSTVVFNKLWIKKPELVGLMSSLVANRVVVTDPVTGSLTASTIKASDLVECCRPIINDTNASPTNTFSSLFVDKNYLKRTLLKPGAILIADEVGNVSSSTIGIPFITQCCDNIKALINDSVEPKSDVLYSSAKTDTLYVKKPNTYKTAAPVSYNAYTGALEMLTLPANSILSTDMNGEIVTTAYSLPDCCDKIKDSIVDYTTTFSSNKIDNTYQRKAVAAPNTFLVLDGYGNLIDSGWTPRQFQDCCQLASEALKPANIDGPDSKIYSTVKADDRFQKKAIAPANAIIMTDASGNLVDSGFTPTVLSSCCTKADQAIPKTAIADSTITDSTLYSSAKIDAVYQKKAIAPVNSLVVLDGNGDLVDSGFTPQFLANCCAQAATGSTDGLMKSDIVDTSTSTTKLFSSEKIDTTYQKKTTAPVNALVMPDANGNLVDSGLTPTAIEACCQNAVAAGNDSLKKTDIVDNQTSTTKLYSSSKIDSTYQKKTTAPPNALLVPDAAGNLVDSGLTIVGIQTCCDKAVAATNNSLLKTDIVDTSTSTTKLYSSSKIDETYQKKSTAPANAIVMMDASGNLIDSGITPTFIDACCSASVNTTNAVANALFKSDIVDTSTSTTQLYSSSKIDATYQKKTTAPPNALLMPDANGNLVDSGLTPAGINACCTQAVDAAANALLKTDIVDASTSTTKLYSSSKIDATYQKKTTAPANALLMPDASGNLVDSGLTPAFITSCCAEASQSTANALVKADIVDTSTSTTKLYSSSKIDSTYQKKTTAPANALLMPDANGNLVDSGLTPTFITTCCTQAANSTANALVKSDIVDTSTSTTKLYSSSKIDTTYQKKTTAPINALLMPDASGNLVDSGLTPTGINSAIANSLVKDDIVDVSTSATKLFSSQKIDATYQKKSTAPANALLMTDAAGNLVDSGITPAFIDACCSSTVSNSTAVANALLKSDIVDTSTSATKLYSSSKIDSTYQKKTTAPANALLMPDANGNLIDSGLTPAGINACCTQAASAATNSLLKTDIVDTSTSTSKLYSSQKIDTTYQKKTTAPANALLMPDAAGNLVDSGLTPTFITACCTQSANALAKTDIVDTSTSTSKLYSSSKIDSTYQKKTTAPPNALLMPDAAGNLVDSGLTPASINACCTQAASAATNSLLKTDIVDTSTSATKLYSSQKIDTTFAKKPTAPANALLTTDASGNLVDSGLTKTGIDACCAQAASAAANSLLKTDIVDTSTSTSKLYSSSKIDATFQKKTTAPANALLMPDASGNLVDSGLTPTFINACCTQSANALAKTDIVDTSTSATKLYSSSKIDSTYQKKTTAPANTFVVPDASGNLVGSGWTLSALNTCCSKADSSLQKADIVDSSTSTTKLYSSSKIDSTYQKKTSAPANALLMPDAAGNLVDSGLTPTFINACCTQAANAASAAANSLLKTDIVDTSVSASKLYSSQKIDSTYQKKSTAPANALLMTDASGNLVDSGLTPTFINTCCAQSGGSTPNVLYLQYTMVFAYFNALANQWNLCSYFTKRADTTGGWYANGKFNPKKAGAWMVKASAWAPRTLGGNRIHWALAQNANMTPMWQDVNSWNNSTQSNLTTFTATVEAIFLLNGTTDYVSAYFMTNSLPQDFDVLENVNMFQAYYLGPV